MEESNIWIASSDGNIQLVREYLKSQSPDTKDETGYTPLHAASSYGHLDLIKLLILEYKANPNSVDNDGDCALHVASDLDSCKLLVELGADVNIRNAEGKLPIEVHMIEGNDEIVEYLNPITPDYVVYEKEIDQDEQLNYLLSELASEQPSEE